MAQRKQTLSERSRTQTQARKRAAERDEWQAEAPTALGRLARSLRRTREDRAFQQAWQAVRGELGIETADLEDRDDYRDVMARMRRLLTAPAPWQQVALTRAEHLAETASAERDVMAFRRQYLAQRLLLPEAVPAWLTQRAGRAVIATRAQRSFALDAASLLAFPGPDGWTSRLGVKSSPALVRLKRLAEALCLRYGWEEAAAVAFVLTGQVPLEWPLKVETHVDGATDALQWVALKVRPGVPPKAVEEAYRQAIRRAPRATVRRASSIKPKHRALVAFVERLGGVVTLDLVRQWNVAHPRWRYDKPGNCRRDYQRTKVRLA